MNNEAINLIDEGCRYGKHPTWKDIPDLNYVGHDLDIKKISRSKVNMSSRNDMKFPNIVLADKSAKITC
jgi:hypothetical protein